MQRSPVEVIDERHQYWIAGAVERIMRKMKSDLET